jgi:hypothetical protein
VQMDAVIAGDAGAAIYGVATEAVFGNPHLAPAPTAPPNPSPYTVYPYDPNSPCGECINITPPPPPPPPPTPTQQFSTLLSSNGIGLR